MDIDPDNPTREEIEFVIARFDEAHRPQLRTILDQAPYLARYYSFVIPQVHFEELPEHIALNCCIYKPCGNTSLTLTRSDTFELAAEVAGEELFRKVQSAEYRRDSNEELFISGSVGELLAALNNVERFPVDVEVRDASDA